MMSYGERITVGDVPATIAQLRRRLDAVEELARSCPPWPWRVAPGEDDVVLAADGVQGLVLADDDIPVTIKTDPEYALLVTEAYALSSNQTRNVARYIAAWHPGAALAAVAVDRLILRMYEQTPTPELLEAVLAIVGKYEPSEGSAS